MSDNNNTQCFDIHEGGGAVSTGASNSITPKRPKSRRRLAQLNDPEQNEVPKNMSKKERIHKPPPPSAKKTAETSKKKGTPSEASTSTRKRRKTSSMKNEGCASSSGVTNSIAPKSEATAPSKSKTKGKPKPKSKSNKKAAANAKKKQGEVPPTYQPRQFIGLYVYKEHNGVKSLGSVTSYDQTKKLFKIGYDDDMTEYMEQNEVLKNMANAKDISEARQALLLSSNSSKTVDRKEQEATLGEESTTRQKISISSGKEEGPGDAIEGSGN